MSEERFPILIQPVYDKHLNWNGFNLALREGGSVSTSLFPQLAEEWEGFAALRQFVFFISLDSAWLNLEIPEIAFPASQVIFVLNKRQAQDGELLAKCRALRGKGFRFAAHGHADDLPAHHETAGIIIADATTAKNTVPDSGWRKVAQSEAKLFATGIDSLELFEWCAGKAFAFHAFASLEGFRNGKNKLQGASRLTLMKLLTLVAQDAETHELELILRKEPKLSFDLLRLVNSASMGLRTKVSSFNHALTILGRRQLQRWLQLLLFAQQNQADSGPSVLMQRAAARGRLMELLTRGISASPSLEFQEQAFMVGVFSLLGILMDDALGNILQSLRLADDIEAALLRRAGVLGEMLQLAECAENFDFEETASRLGKLNMAPEFFSLAQASALGWTHRLNVSD